MKQVATISQTLRAFHCHVYMRDGMDEQIILTTDPAAFAGLDFAAPTRIVATTPPPELLPAARLNRTRVFRRMLSWARSGSAFGRWLEDTAKHFVARFRRWPSSTPNGGFPTGAVVSTAALESSDMYLRLVEEHEVGPIDRIVVFDLFDLPVVLRFSDRHEVEVLVR